MKGSCHCGKINWQFDGTPESATACNCTVCRRYGVLWAYGHEGENIHITGDTQEYVQGDKTIGFHFCPACACILAWRSLEPDSEGRRRIAVNLRLTEPDNVARLPIDHFDGLVTFDDLPRDGKCVADYWF